VDSPEKGIVGDREARADGRHEPGIASGTAVASGTLLLLAAWFGLAAGLLELALLSVRVLAFEKGFFLRSRHFLWMVPLSELLIFTSLGLVLVCLFVAGRWKSDRLSIGILILLFCMSQLLLVRGLNLVTCTLISCGLAVRMSGPMVKRLPRMQPYLPAGLAVLLIALVGLAGAAVGWERHGLAALPKGQIEVSIVPRNVLLIVLDTVRADHLSLYGYDRDTTPNLKKLAREGVRFEHARAAAPWTLPSHASLFTGRWPHELGVEERGWLDGRFTTLAEFLGARGYATAGFVANQFFCGHESGLSRGYACYQDYPVNLAEIVRSSTLGWLLLRSTLRVRDELHWALLSEPAGGLSVDFSRKDAATVNREFLDWHSGHGRQPFFAFLNYFDAHDPYLSAPSVTVPIEGAPRSRGQFAMLRDWYKVNKKELSAADIALARNAYDDCIAALDQELGRLFDALRERGILDQTLVVLTADHGEHFGENGIFGHGMSLHDPEVHVPLLMIAPAGVPCGKVIAGGVSLRDIPRTIVDLLGFAGACPFPGESLARTWQSPAPGTERSISPALSELHTPIEETIDPDKSRGPMQALLAESNAYIRHQGGDEELYALDADPTESHDLSKQEEAGPILARCRAIVNQAMGMKVTSKPSAAGEGAPAHHVSDAGVGAGPDVGGE
jgi:arylsulfatase A-like enzyme